ncbi:Alginate export [Capnocytophaga haemolytica]|uniref:Alginate export domain-containing protein n=1 Tax=Capnocytophaga haemolytica TaxID=45243 RepID=A0AAX2H2F6_9FLAO|nr:alginate export family protein [Capnocytophaga haemolytica]SFN84086.1 Alginate export [Capnocytophaga haemolytica]SNV16124.1 Uncharacterised protein [Capnocytophaga haemolytica]
MKKLVLSALFVAAATTLSAQDFSIDANLKSRAEYRHGQGAVFPSGAEPAFFVGQRVRLGGTFEKDWLTLRLSGQQIFTWGSAGQPVGEQPTQFGVYEAWAGLRLGDSWGLKLGRQVFSYDDERVLGELDWSHYGRFHDGALVRYNSNGWDADLALAFNQQGQPTVGNDYLIVKGTSYKAMQFLHLNKKWDGNTVSFLFMNTGFQNVASPTGADGVSQMQTTGLYGKFPINALTLEASAYYQFGKYNKTDVSAYQWRLEATYQLPKVLVGLGAEMLSGKKDGDKIKKFKPLFGTNHKFNGFMDLYYVGSTEGDTGLNDYYAKANVKFNEKSSLLFMPHVFTRNVTPSGAKSYLGTELDFVYSNKLMQDVVLNVGYSHHFASDELGIGKSGVQNWAYAELLIRPTLFSHKAPKQVEEVMIEQVEMPTEAPAQAQ